MVTEVKPQLSKAPSPILVTDAGMVTDVKSWQSTKAWSPILVTDAGMVMEVKLKQQ
jgi:hypothetical protein